MAGGAAVELWLPVLPVLIGKEGVVGLEVGAGGLNAKGGIGVLGTLMCCCGSCGIFFFCRGLRPAFLG